MSKAWVTVDAHGDETCGLWRKRPEYLDGEYCSGTLDWDEISYSMVTHLAGRKLAPGDIQEIEVGNAGEHDKIVGLIAGAACAINDAIVDGQCTTRLVSLLAEIQESGVFAEGKSDAV